MFIPPGNVRVVPSLYIGSHVNACTLGSLVILIVNLCPSTGVPVGAWNAAAVASAVILYWIFNPNNQASGVGIASVTTVVT